MKLQAISCSINATIELAWKEQLEKANYYPDLAEAIRHNGVEVESRFAYFYQQLIALPRRTRRAFCRKLALPIAGAAMMLALGNQPLSAATISVDGTSCTLIDAITAANSDSVVGGCSAGNGADILELDAGSTHTLHSVNNNTYGDTGLPVVESVLTIGGNGSTIQRDSNAPDFGIFGLWI